MFVDECEIDVRAGDGGDGCISFRREKYIPRGGPDGGDGGNGGDVVLHVNPHLRTLSHLRHTPAFRAASGSPGRGKKMSGAQGERAIVEVPPGTILCDARTGEIIVDASTAGSEHNLARGGCGGKGNFRFRSATRRAPRIAGEGTPGEHRRLRLTLKLLADVGLVGLPNAGKSTLLARLSNAKPKIAGYPFTTLAPVLGIVPVGEESSLVLADLPGLIEGAHAGKGLGQRFLRHIERTRLLLILIESIDPQPEATYRILRRELELWSKDLGARQSLVCLTKADVLDAHARARLTEVAGQRPHLVSSQTGEGIPELLHALDDRIREIERAAPMADDDGPEAPPDFGARPWPTAWRLPARAGVLVPGSHAAEE
jgi:GTP-binding protein